MGRDFLWMRRAGPLGGVGIKPSVTTLTGSGNWWHLQLFSSLHSKIFVTLVFCHLHLAWVECGLENIPSLKYHRTRSLGVLRAPTSSWWSYGSVYGLRPTQSLPPLICLMQVSMMQQYISIMHVSTMHVMYQ